MSFSFIGTISLNISFILYMIFYLPQLLHNQLYKKTSELSLLMHVILCIATIADLLYGFGRNMQWQYRMVTLVSLLSLSIQHIQICLNDNKSYKLLTFNLVGLLALAVILLQLHSLPTSFFIDAGFISQLGGFFYTIPQIIKNNQLKSTSGMSVYFVLFGISLNVLDSISAWTLNWDWPSKLGSPLSIIFGLILMRQFSMHADQRHFATAK